MGIIICGMIKIIQDKFLKMKKKIKMTFLFLQKLAHEYHKHFEKHKKFVGSFRIDKYEFMDLFPIWRIVKNHLKKI